MRYLVDDSKLDPSHAAALYRIILSWAAARGTMFELHLDPTVFDDPADLQRLRQLGKESLEPVSMPADRLGQALVRLFKQPTSSLVVRGIPDQRFVQELTTMTAPLRAVSGDLCPAEELLIYRDERESYAVYEYGRTQLLNLTDGDLQELLQSLEKAGLDKSRIVPASSDPTSRP